MCGGAANCRRCRPRFAGSIPACAGKPWRDCREPTAQGSIPACAGEPQCSADRIRAIAGSIPACAGEPRRHAETRFRRHSGPSPRVRGSLAEDQHFASLAGPSPRVRGSRRPRRLCRGAGRFIPACAGERTTAGSATLDVGSSPRVRGSRLAGDLVGVDQSGPSPRVRGSLRRKRSDRRVGSIPACAGEPTPTYLAIWEIGSIPACAGEPINPARHGHRCAGPSPRVRGSRAPQRGDSTSQGSIPACAGEPSTGCRTMSRIGSIPACAGEPRWPAGARRRGSILQSYQTLQYRLRIMERSMCGQHFTMSNSGFAMKRNSDRCDCAGP